MRLTNDRYLITLHIGRAAERYYRVADGWVKESMRGRKFKASPRRPADAVVAQ